MNLPLLLAGPILRRVDTTTASVWLALRDPSKVVMKVWEGRAKSGQAHPLAASPSTPTLRVGAKLNVVVVTVEIPATAGVSFQPDSVYSYDVEITDSSNTVRTLKTLHMLEEGFFDGFRPLAAGIRAGLPADFRSATIRSHQSPSLVRVLPTSGSSDCRCPRACRRPDLRPRQIQGRAHPPTPAVPGRRPDICR